MRTVLTSDEHFEWVRKLLDAKHEWAARTGVEPTRVYVSARMQRSLLEHSPAHDPMMDLLGDCFGRDVAGMDWYLDRNLLADAFRFE